MFKSICSRALHLLLIGMAGSAVSFAQPAQLATVDSVAYELVKSTTGVLAKPAGSISLGVKCGAEQQGTGFHSVPHESVVFTNKTRTPDSVVARCSATRDSSAAAAISARAKKWNPGHYVRPNAPGLTDNAEDRARAFNLIRGNTLFKGGIISVPWGTIEIREGVYDFTVIDTDLKYLKTMGKKLIIEVWWEKFNVNVPDDRYFPRYIWDAGGVWVRKGNSPAYSTVRMDEARWADRYVALQKALAARYDSDPDVEQVVITETAATSAYEFQRIVPAVAAAWPKTQVILYPNWVDTPELARDLLALMARLGVGIGGPDILGPPGYDYEDHGSQALRGVGMRATWGGDSKKGDFGTVDYRGQIPVAYQYQALNGVPPQKVIDYALNELKATHIGWSISTEDPALGWEQGVLPTVKTVNGRTVTDYPTRLPR